MSDCELLQILCPFGEWNNIKGVQIVDEESAQRMICAAKKRLKKIPIYIGHPEDNPFKKAKPVGRVKQICRTTGGIAVSAEYFSGLVYHEVASGVITAMSPRWKVETAGDKFRPVELLSVALTNTPNIPASGKIINICEVAK